MKEFIDWLVATYHKLRAQFMEWWCELEDNPVTEEDGAVLAENLYANPIRKRIEKLKKLMYNSIGKGGVLALVASVSTLGFIILTGGTSVTSIFGVSLAAIVGAMIAISRFPVLEQFLSYKWVRNTVDLILFVGLFLMANTIFGIQAAAIIGLLTTVALLWNKMWSDAKLHKRIAEAEEEIPVVMEVLGALAPA